MLIRQLFLFILCLSASFVQAQTSSLHLGNPLSQSQTIAISTDEMVLRTGKVSINHPETLNETLYNADTLSLMLFPNVSVTASKTTVRVTGNGSIYWSGNLINGKHGVFNVLYSNGYVAGSVHDYNSDRVYDITAENQQVISISEWDVSNESGHIHNEDCFEHEEIAEEEQTDSQPAKAIATASNPAVIDVLILYPTKTAQLMGTSEAIRKAKIEKYIEETNQIFINSEVYVTFRLVGHEINDVIPHNATSASDVRNASGVSALREQYGADIVSHWNYDGSAGSGYVGGPSVSRTAGFNTSKYSSVTLQYTFAHECGHNLGARHDRYEYRDTVAVLLSSPGYQFGKCFLTYRTVMAYNNSKYLPGAENTSRNRIMHYSNPNVLYNGVPTGVAGTTPSTIVDGGPANVARMINECAKNAENWTPTKIKKFTLTVNNGSGSGQYETGTQVPIEADPAPSGYEFAQWTGDISGVADIYAAATTYTTTNTDATVTATYNMIISKFTLTVNNGSGSGQYETGTQVPIEADPALSGYEFAQWTGDINGVADLHAAATTYTTTNTDATVTATYNSVSNAIVNRTNHHLSIYKKASSLIIESDAVIQSVSVYNPTGVKIYTALPNNTEAQISGIPEGIFLVKIVWQNGTTEVRKVFIPVFALQ